MQQLQQNNNRQFNPGNQQNNGRIQGKARNPPQRILRNPGAGANPQVQNAPVQGQAANIDSAKKDHLEVRDGTITHIKSRYIFSEKADKILRAHFSYLIADSSQTRYYVGGKYGYVRHGHSLGAFLRSLGDDEIMYNYWPEHEIKDIGPSIPRTLKRWNVNDSVCQPWLLRTHMMNPILGVQDDLRMNDNATRIPEYLKEINTLLRKKDPTHVDITYDKQKHLVSKNHCHHVFGGAKPQQPCGCQKRMAIKMVESYYYPHVLNQAYTELAESLMANDLQANNAFIIGNDYFRGLLENKKEVAKTFVDSKSTLAESLDFVLAACENTEGVPESVHSIYCSEDKADNNSKLLRVTAEVIDNPIPYDHNIPLTSSANAFLVPFELQIPKGGKAKFFMMYEKLKQINNGLVPFVTYRVRATLQDRWPKEQLRKMTIVPNRFATFDDLFEKIVDELPDLVRTKSQELSESLEITKDDKALFAGDKPITFADIAPKEEEVDIDAFDEELYKQKLENSPEMARINPELQKKYKESNYEFIRFMKRQFKDRDNSHSMHVRYIDGKAYFVLRKHERSFFNLLVSYKKSSTAMAPVSEVAAAYKAIGIKKSLDSILSSMKAQQRTQYKDDVDESMFSNVEAFAIATYIASMERHRLGALVGNVATSAI